MTHHFSGTYPTPSRLKVRRRTLLERIRAFLDRHDWIEEVCIVFILAMGMLCMLWWLAVAR